MEITDVNQVVLNSIDYLVRVHPKDTFTLYELFSSFGMSDTDFTQMKQSFYAVREFYRILEERSIMVIKEHMGFEACLPWYARLHLALR